MHKKWSFPLRISSVNVTKSAVSCEFGHIYWGSPKWKTSFFVQWEFLSSEADANGFSTEWLFQTAAKTSMKTCKCTSKGLHNGCFTSKQTSKGKIKFFQCQCWCWDANVEISRWPLRASPVYTKLNVWLSPWILLLLLEVPFTVANETNRPDVITAKVCAAEDTRYAESSWIYNLYNLFYSA